MKIAIHHRDGSFSVRWIEYCKKNKIEFKIVDAFNSDLIEQIKDCDVFLWHYHHYHFKDALTAKRILFSLEHSGIKVFPNFETNWHFDDKVAQKYLLEAIDAPIVPSYAFYDKKIALDWVERTDFPKVWKLKGGAGSQNVQLVNTRRQARNLIRKAFKRGFSQFNRLGYFKERLRRVKKGEENFIGIIKGLIRLVVPTEFAEKQHREKGYIYFQDFIPNNSFDIRIIIIGNRAFGLKRLVRKNDFRASGSGDILYDPKELDLKCVRLAFEINRKLNAQSIAFDFVFDKNTDPLIVEISYGFSMYPYDLCPGFWNENLKWYEEKFNPQEWIIENLIKS